MDSDQTQYTLLAHFDRPKTADIREFAWAEVEDTDCAAPLVARYVRPQPPAVTRGISWVLLWAMAFAVLAIAASVLVEFSYVLVGEHSLRLAARAVPPKRLCHERHTKLSQQQLSGG